MAIRSRVATRRHKPRALALRVEVGKEAVIRKMQRVVKIALTVATERTPKWSGEATLAWEVSFDRIPAVEPSFREFDEPEYPEGMRDPKAKAVNEFVARGQYYYAKAEISRRVKAGKDFQVYVTNTAEHAQFWLKGNEALANYLLRDVNRDYYDYQDIMSAVRSQAKGAF